MIRQRYRAIEFVHPDFGRRTGEAAVSSGDAGMRLAPNRRLAEVNGEDSVRQSILLLLTTRPGERVMRPEYGCNLYKLLFSPNDESTAGLALHYVRQALERWEPRIRILRLDATKSGAAGEVLELQLEYRVLISDHVERLIVPVSLAGKEV